MELFDVLVKSDMAYVYEGMDAGDYLVFHVPDKGWYSMSITETIREERKVKLFSMHFHGEDEGYTKEFHEAKPHQIIKEDHKLLTAMKQMEDKEHGKAWETIRDMAMRNR